MRTNYEYEPLRLRAPERVLLHAIDDGTRKVAVEDGADVDEVEDKPNEQEPPHRA